MKNTISSYNKFRIMLPAIVALLVFVVVYGAILLFNLGRNRQFQFDERERVKAVVDVQQSALETSINLRLGAAYSMAAFALSNQDRLPESFAGFARQLYNLTPGLRSVQIAPDGVLAYVYPIAGNEQALGLNLATHPGRKADFERRLAKKSLTLAGPFELVQGGLGPVGQIPIYQQQATNGTSSQTEQDQFWGVGVTVIDVPLLLAEAGLLENNNHLAVRSLNNQGEAHPAFS